MVFIIHIHIKHRLNSFINSIYIITERIDNEQFTGNNYVTTMKNYTFVDDKLISKYSALQGGEFGTITISGVEYPIYTAKGETHYYYHDDNFYFAADMYRNKPGTIYVSAFDSEGKIIASAPLTDAPEEIKPYEFVEGVDTNLVNADSWISNKYITGSSANVGKHNHNTEYTTNDFIEFIVDNTGKIVNSDGQEIKFYLKVQSDLSDNNKGDNRMLIAVKSDDTYTIKGTYVKLQATSTFYSSRISSDDGYKIYELNFIDIFSNHYNTNQSSNIDLTNSSNWGKTYAFKICLHTEYAPASYIYAKVVEE